MNNSHQEQWLETVRKYAANFSKPGHERFWCPELETAPRSRLLEIQSEKLVVAYRYLWDCSQFYRKKFEEAGLGPNSVQSLDDLTKIPVTQREEWLQDQEQYPPWGTFSPLSQENWLDSGWMLFMTSGTRAARPRVFRHTSFDKDMWSWLGARALYAMGVRRGDIAINCFGYGTAVGFWALHYALNHMGIPVISGGGANSERRAFLIHSFRPTVLVCTPSYALYLGRVMQECGHSPEDSSIRLIVVAGEPGACVPATKRRIESLWQAELHDDFGCTEVAMTPLGYTCPEQVRQKEHPVDVHMMEDVYIPEVLHPVTLTPVLEGERGVLTVSNLFSEAQPILRYVMGDWISVTTDPCSCGRTHARAIGGLQGRADSLIKIRGLMFFPATIEDSIRAQPDAGDEYRVEISRARNMDRIKVSVEPNSPVPKANFSELEARIARGLKGSLGIEVDVEVLAYGSLPRTEAKASRLVDLRETLF